MKKFEHLPENFKNAEAEKYYRILAAKKTALFVKRLFDLLFSCIIFLLLLPFIVVIAVVVKCTSKGPVFFKQKRVGRYGKPFAILKFRTMVRDAEKLGAKITVGERDPRITPAGHFLRKFRLDEFPQLINVIKGEMTFVGTRPEVPEYVAKYTGEMTATLLLPPGITSIASICFKDESALLSEQENPEDYYIDVILPQKMRLNLEYIEKFSLFYDFKLLCKTLTGVIK